MAKEALELHLYSMEEDQEPIPKPSQPEPSRVPQGAMVALVEAWMPVIRSKIANQSVKKFDGPQMVSRCGRSGGHQLFPGPPRCPESASWSGGGFARPPPPVNVSQ